MAIAPVVTLGFGSFGSVNHVVTMGFAIESGAPEPPDPPEGNTPALIVQRRRRMLFRRRER